MIWSRGRLLSVGICFELLDYGSIYCTSGFWFYIVALALSVDELGNISFAACQRAFSTVTI